MRPYQMHIHSFSLRYQFRYRDDFDVFDFIRLAKVEGFDGVNISANGPGYRDLSGTTAAHFANVKAAVREHDLGCELDTSNTEVAHMRTMLAVAAACGADQLRTYTRYTLPREELIEQTVSDLSELAPEAAELGITIVLENHEDFRGPELREICERVEHPNVRILYDYGNSQMVGEDPLEALETVMPFVSAVHIKDHVLIEHKGAHYIQGVTMGSGDLPIVEQSRMLFEGGLRRYCYENVWSYVAPLKVSVDQLPKRPWFQIRDVPYLWGDDLPRESALEQELIAFHAAWDWLRSQDLSGVSESS